MSELFFAYYFTTDQYVYQSMRTKNFSSATYGYKIFKDVLEKLVEASLVVHSMEERDEGKRRINASRFTLPAAVINSIETSYISKEELKKQLKNYRPFELIKAKYPKPARKGKTRPEAKDVPFNEILRSPDAASAILRLDRLNLGLSRHTLGGGEHFIGLQRAFNNFSENSDPPYRLRDGGRLYCPSENSYQSMKSNQRANLTIDGEAVVEIDVKSSQPTLALYTACATSSNTDYIDSYDFNEGTIDPYDIPGFPRDVIKACFIQLISKDMTSTRWGDDAKQRLKVNELNISFKDVARAIELRHPVLFDTNRQSIDWAYLQRREADAMLATLEILIHEHDIAAFPVHDSIIVRAKDEAIASDTMKAVFKSHLGFVPNLKTS
jgi:hypothetical protein